MDEFFSILEKHIFALRDMGCAVIVVTPEDISYQFYEDDEPMPMDKAATWLRDNQDAVEQAINGDYLSDTLHNLKNWTDRKASEGTK